MITSISNNTCSQTWVPIDTTTFIFINDFVCDPLLCKLSFVFDIVFSIYNKYALAKIYE